MKLILYYAPVACAMVPYINLIEAGLDREPLALTKQSPNGVAERFPRLDLIRIHQIH